LSHTIALVDNDRNILTSVAIALEAEGFRVRAFGGGVEALKSLAESPVDLVVLDIKMPRMDGMELLTRLRRKSLVPVVFLTSKEEEIDEVVGLKMGADDFIRKPFSMRLLIERIRAVLRRADLVSGDDDEAGVEPKMVRGNLMLDSIRYECTWRGKIVTLTVTEYLILKFLASRPGHIRSRNQLMDVAYDDNIYVDDRTIDSHIKRIRKKLKATDPAFSQIETLYGVGYRYADGDHGL